MMKLKFRSSVFLGYLLVSGVIVAPARAEKWPVSGYIEKVFRQGEPFGFSDWEGVNINGSPLKSIDEFDYLPVQWAKAVPCGHEARPNGYLHSNPVISSRGKKLWVAVPVRFSIQSTHSGQRKMEVLKSQFFKISLMGLNSNEMKLHRLQKSQIYSLNDLFMKSAAFAEDQSSHLNFSFSGVLYTKPVEVAAGTNYRVRIEWFGDGLCGEQNLTFSVGEQIRIYKSHEFL